MPQSPHAGLATLEQELVELRAEMRGLRAAETRRQQRARAALRIGALAMALLGIGYAGGAMALSCPGGELFCFNGGTPAKASEVNHNFAQLKVWLQNKVGVDLNSGSVAVPGALGVAGTATHGGATVLNGATRIQTGGTSNASSASGKPLFVSGVAADGSTGSGGVEFRHDNLTQGVGIGYNTVYATGSNADQNLNLRARGGGRVRVDGTLVESGYELSCIESSYTSSLVGYAHCCRINVRNGETRCNRSTGANGHTWSASSSVYPGLSATTESRYHLSCVAGAPGANFPFCCRVNGATGAVSCGQGNTYTLGTAGTSTVPF